MTYIKLKSEDKKYFERLFIKGLAETVFGRERLVHGPLKGTLDMAYRGAKKLFIQNAFMIGYDYKTKRSLESLPDLHNDDSALIYVDRIKVPKQTPFMKENLPATLKYSMRRTKQLLEENLQRRLNPHNPAFLKKEFGDDLPEMIARDKRNTELEIRGARDLYDAVQRLMK